MDKKIIGLDLDEVLAELLQACILIHDGKLAEHPLIWDEISSYNLHEHYPVDRQVVYDFFYRPFLDPQLTKQILPVIGAFEKLQDFKAQGHTLYVITARQDNLKQHTLDFLYTHYPNLIDDVYFANHFTEKSLHKHDICRDIGVQVMVEDNFDYAQGIAAEGILTYLLEKPWNKHRESRSQNIIRVSDWSQIHI